MCGIALGAESSSSPHIAGQTPSQPSPTTVQFLPAGDMLAAAESKPLAMQPMANLGGRRQWSYTVAGICGLCALAAGGFIGYAATAMGS